MLIWEALLYGVSVIISNYIAGLPSREKNGKIAWENSWRSESDKGLNSSLYDKKESDHLRSDQNATTS